MEQAETSSTSIKDCAVMFFVSIQIAPIFVLSSVYHRCREKFGAKINAKFSQLSWYYVAKKCDKKRDIAFFLHLL